MSLCVAGGVAFVIMPFVVYVLTHASTPRTIKRFTWNETAPISTQNHEADDTERGFKNVTMTAVDLARELSKLALYKDGIGSNEALGRLAKQPLDIWQQLPREFRFARGYEPTMRALEVKGTFIEHFTSVAGDASLKHCARAEGFIPNTWRLAGVCIKNMDELVSGSSPLDAPCPTQRDPQSTREISSGKKLGHFCRCARQSQEYTWVLKPGFGTYGANSTNSPIMMLIGVHSLLIVCAYGRERGHC